MRLTVGFEVWDTWNLESPPLRLMHLRNAHARYTLSLLRAPLYHCEAVGLSFTYLENANETSGHGEFSTYEKSKVRCLHGS